MIYLPIFHTRFIHGDELRDHLQDLDPTQETIVYCRVGLRGYLAARILLQHGLHQRLQPHRWNPELSFPSFMKLIFLEIVRHLSIHGYKEG